MHRIGLSAILVPLFFLAATIQSGQPSQKPAPRAGALPLRGRVIVKFKDSISVPVERLVANHESFLRNISDPSDSLDALFSRFGVTSATPLFPIRQRAGSTNLNESYRLHFRSIVEKYPVRSQRIPQGASLPSLHQVYVLQISEDLDPEVVAEALQQDPHVEYAHPDYVVQANFAPNDPYYKSSGSWNQKYDDLWALKRDKLNMEAAWNITKGEGIIVAVVDTGVDYNHPDIQANIWSNPGEVPGNQLDDDGNGYVDDVRGWDFVTCDVPVLDGCSGPRPPDNDPMDDGFHGTHVAGTIAAVGNNNLGIIGVAPKAKIMPVKALGIDGGGILSELAAGIVYAASNGADVINNSWGCQFCPQAGIIRDAIRTAQGLGAVIVFSAGNSTTDVREFSPQNLHENKPIVVAASDPRDQPTFFSNFGATVDVIAPGGGKSSREVNILSLRSTACHGCDESWLEGDAYLRLQGTSMSAPHVSGVAALVISHSPTLKVDQVRQILMASADDLRPGGFDLQTGAGRINAQRALTVAAPLEVKITEPRHLSLTRRDLLTIRGTVMGPGLKQYQLYYVANENDPWKPLGEPSDSPVINGTLGVVPTGSLPFGWKSIKVEAVTTDGMKFADVINVGTQLAVAKRLPSSEKKGSSYDPDVSGNLVVWVGEYNGTTRAGHIYLYDLEKGYRKKISDQTFVRPAPRVSGNLITWTDLKSPRNNTLYACVYNPATRQCPVQVIRAGEIFSYATSENRIVYSSFDAVRGGVRLYDVKTRKDTRLSLVAGTADIAGDLAVWSIGRVLVVRDLKTGKGRRIGQETSFIRDYPKISGHRIVYRNLVNNFPKLRVDLYEYDLDTNKERLLFRDFKGDWNVGKSPLSGNRFVWSSFAEVFLLDLDSFVNHGLAIAPILLRDFPAIDGNRAVWMEVTNRFEGTGEIVTTLIPPNVAPGSPGVR